MPTLLGAIKRLRDRGLFPLGGIIDVKELFKRFQPVPPGSMRALLAAMDNIADAAQPVGGSISPFYQRARPTSFGMRAFGGNTLYINFTNPDSHLVPFREADPVAKANDLFDERAAAVLRTAIGPRPLDSYWPGQDIFNLVDAGLLDHTSYPESGTVPVNNPKVRCLALLAIPDYFNIPGFNAHSAVSEAILIANPGWCGTFGPVADGSIDFLLGGTDEGNYDMAQMHMLFMAYRHYNELTPDAREHLIGSLLAGGTIHGPGQDDTHTRGPCPEYWSRAGVISPLGNKKRIGETENHLLMILTARYLTNQLLYQRDPSIFFDNRRNSPYEITKSFRILDPTSGVRDEPVPPHQAPGPGSCAFILLDLLQRILRDDFSEYNAKNYQRETRNALLNLCSFSYDHEVRLAARMALDYLSAHYVVSSNDLRRLLPFRRLNVDNKVARDQRGFMTCGLLEWQDGADSMPQAFAVLSGNTRAYESLPPAEYPDHPEQNRPATSWTIRDGGGDQVLDVLSDYRLPPSIHHLFLNDQHRRFFQRLHRFMRSDDDEVGGNRNADNMEIYAGSPSYLITAGGAPASYAIDPYFLGVPRGHAEKQLGVAVTTSFIPTTYSDKAIKADDTIQFSYFSDTPTITANYGVAPDFACGHQIKLPTWLTALRGTASYVQEGNFTFINRKAVALQPDRPGFYLAIYQENSLAFMETFDTWLHPGVNFAEFQAGVKARNLPLQLQNNVPCHYTTSNGNQLEFHVSVAVSDMGVVFAGAGVTKIIYGAIDPHDSFGDAGNVTDRFLNGTVMNSTKDATIELTNHFLPEKSNKLTLDMSDLLHPQRISENGEVEQAGFLSEVWVNFAWKGPSEGDFFRPFTTISAAAAKVAENGVIKIMPGWSTEKPVYQIQKRIRIAAPLGGVTFGVR